MGNMFCGYACIVYSMRGDFESAAPYIGISIVLDMLDGRIARLTGTSSEFGVQLDSLADAISFGVAPAILSYAWGLQPLGRLGMFCGLSLRQRWRPQAGAVQHPERRGRGQALLRRHAEPGRRGDSRRDGLSPLRSASPTTARRCQCSPWCWCLRC